MEKIEIATRLLAVCAGATLLTGCPSVSTFGLARTLNQGAVQGWVAPGGGASFVSTTSGTSTATATAAYPVLEGGVRYGITDRVELGGRLGFSGVSVDGKFGLVRSPNMEHGVNLSLDPGVGFIGYGASAGSGSSSSSTFIGVLNLTLPVLFGIDFGGHELVLGPRLIDQVFFGNVASSSGGTSASGSGTGDVLYVGGSIGFAIRASAAVRIIPEVSVGVPVWASFDQSSTSSGFGGLAFQGGVAIVFGSSNQYEAPEPPPPPPTMQPPPPPPGPPPPAPPPPAPPPPGP